jgi:hypothetical protein
MQLPVLTLTAQVLPPLYAGWMDELLGGPIPAETEATCENCAMCTEGPHRPAGSDYLFDPKTKCCTYIPELPNFLVGRILSDDDPALAAGRASVEKRLSEGLAVSPMGIGRSPTQRFMYALTAQTQAFGRNPDLRCPHYIEGQAGNCGIWRHRNSICATWFCKYVRGAVGAHFWRSLLQLLVTAEVNLIQWCICELDLGEGSLQRVLGAPGPDVPRSDPICEGELDGRADEATRRAVWGKWFARERAFFVECARRVEGLSWREVAGLCGTQMRVQELLVRRAYEQLLSDALPPALRGGSFQIVKGGRTHTRVRTYSPLDPLDVPRAVMEALPFFDGRPTEAAVREIAMQKGMYLDESLLRKLADFQILVPGEPPTLAGSSLSTI